MWEQLQCVYRAHNHFNEHYQLGVARLEGRACRLRPTKTLLECVLSQTRAVDNFYTFGGGGGGGRGGHTVKIGLNQCHILRSKFSLINSYVIFVTA